MSDHALPVTPAVGDEVAVRYRSRQAEDGEAVRQGTLVRVAEGRSSGGVYRHLLVREDDSTLLVTGVRPDGSGMAAYSVNYDDGGEPPSVTAWTADGGSWSLRWAEGDKTRRVRLGRTLAVELVAVAE